MVYTLNTTKEVIINKLIKDRVSETTISKCLAHHYHSNALNSNEDALYMVRAIYDTEENEIKRYIEVDVFSYGYIIGSIGYKGMDELSFPYFYDCPLEFLEIVPEVTCQEWRDLVKERHGV